MDSCKNQYASKNPDTGETKREEIKIKGKIFLALIEEALYKY